MTPKNASVVNAFQILRLIGARGPELSLADMARTLDLSPAAVHRLVATLQEVGAVVRPRRNAYRLSPGLADLAEAVDTTAVLTALARAPVRRLVQTLGEVVHLGTFDGEMVTYLVKGSPRKKTIVPTREGTQLEAYSSGVGKALLAHLPEPELDAYLSSAPFIPLTEHTITEPGAIRAELAKARRDGYAMDNEEVVPGLTCLAVPILAPSGRAIASLSVSAPTEVFTPEFRRTALENLQGEVRTLESRLFGRMGAGDPGHHRPA
ncbi:MAG: IclR family transcriptional regulator [Alphaproteobacteria bacterium]|nr:MAG: IclR family transcriptional regulator [Alphaproteobacteria bacterium]